MGGGSKLIIKLLGNSEGISSEEVVSILSILFFPLNLSFTTILLLKIKGRNFNIPSITPTNPAKLIPNKLIIVKKPVGLL